MQNSREFPGIPEREFPVALIEGTKARHGGAKPEGVGSGNFEI